MSFQKACLPNSQAGLTARQVCEYLRICRKTLYRLIKRGRLTGYRIHRRWYFKPDDVEAYRNYRRRIKYYGRIFPAPMLMKYHQAPYKYQVTKKKRGLIGYLSLRPEYLSRMKKPLRRTASGSRSVTHGGLPHSGKGLSLKQAAREYFKPIKYHRVRLEGGFLIIVVSQRDFDRLPKAEQRWWLRFEMKPERIRQEMEK